MAHIKITKDGKSNTILGKMDWAKSVYPTSDGYTHEVVDVSLGEEFDKVLKEIEGRLWRDDELVRTDSLISLPDHPDKDNLTAYRQKLRDWPSTDDYPDTRPTIGS